MQNQVMKGAADDLAAREDRDLMAACLEGESAAWEVLINRYKRLIYSIPFKARLSADDAADVFQTVCLKLYQNLKALRDHEKISSWLITTTTREVWRTSSRNRRAMVADSADDGDGLDALSQIPAAGPLADEQRELLEQQQTLREAVDSLPERCHKLVTMLFYEKEDLSYADIARRMNMPVPSVGPTRARCLEKLRKLLLGRI